MPKVLKSWTAVIWGVVWAVLLGAGEGFALTAVAPSVFNTREGRYALLTVMAWSAGKFLVAWLRDNRPPGWEE